MPKKMTSKKNFFTEFIIKTQLFDKFNNPRLFSKFEKIVDLIRILKEFSIVMKFSYCESWKTAPFIKINWADFKLNIEIFDSMQNYFVYIMRENLREFKLKKKTVFITMLLLEIINISLPKSSIS